MPAKWFICPDGVKITIEECLARAGCRRKNRCMPITLLRDIGYSREFRGVTASSAGKGARQIWLDAVTNYAIDPDSRMFAVLGTRVHNKLASERLTDNVLAEEQLDVGRPDMLEEDEFNPGKFILYDYKTWGSFRVAKAQGIKTVSREVDNPDGKIKKTKKIKEIINVPPDLTDISLQLNRYRMDFEKKGFTISHMRVFCIVRDGGVFLALDRGIKKNSYPIEVPRIDNEWVEAYYHELGFSVYTALETGYAPICDAWETWDGAFCEKYCNVKNECLEIARDRREWHWLPFPQKEVA